MSSTENGTEHVPGRVDRRQGDRRLVVDQLRGHDRRTAERRSGDERRQAPRTRLMP